MNEAKMKELEASLDEAKERNQELEKQLADMTAKFGDLEIAHKELEGQVGELKSKLETAEGRATSLVEQARCEALKAHLDEDEWEKQKATIMAMTDEAFALMASVAGRPETKTEPVSLAGKEDDKDGVVKWEIG